MLKKMLATCAMSFPLLMWSPAANAQWAVHALSGTVKSIYPKINTIDIVTTDGSHGQFKTMEKSTEAMDFDQQLRAKSTPSAAFRTIGAHVVVYYYGFGDDRTAVSLQDLGSGPFKDATGKVADFNKHSRVLSVQMEQGKTATFQVSDTAIIDTGSGLKEGSKFEPHKGDSLQVTSASEHGTEEALFISRRRS